MYVTTSIKMKAKERKILDFVQTCVDERFVTNQISKILNGYFCYHSLSIFSQSNHHMKER